MKGIILAGGAGSRLHPLTSVITKQLLPVYDKPMIYYPLSLLMLGGIREILIITTAYDLPFFEKILGNGSQWGLSLQYKVQEKPNGLPEAFILGEKFIGTSPVALILGDNLFYGDIRFFRDALKNKMANPGKQESFIFAYPVSDPERYGVVEFDKTTGKVISLEEKPKQPKSKYAIPGLYLFDSTVSARSKALKPSARGEIEIVDLLKSYHKEDSLFTQIITRGIAWLDTGTPRSLLEASSYIAAIEERQGLKVACLEEIALRMKFITNDQYLANLQKVPNSLYKKYLEEIYKDITE